MLLVVTLCMVQHEAGVHTQVSFARRAPIGGQFPASGIPAAAANTTVAFILCELREMVSSCEPYWMVNGWIRRKDVLTSIKPLNELSGNRYYKIKAALTVGGETPQEKVERLQSEFFGGMYWRNESQPLNPIMLSSMDISCGFCSRL